MSQDNAIRRQSFVDKLPVWSRSKGIIIEKYVSKDAVDTDEVKCIVFRATSNVPDAVSTNIPEDAWRIGLRFNGKLYDRKCGGRFAGYLLQIRYIGEKFYDFVRSLFSDLVQLSAAGTVVRGSSVSTIIPSAAPKVDEATPYSWETPKVTATRRQRDEDSQKDGQQEISALLLKLASLLEAEKKKKK